MALQEPQGGAPAAAGLGRPVPAMFLLPVKGALGTLQHYLDIPEQKCSCRSSRVAPPQQLRLELAAALMPHPNKAHRGGEDAVFLSDDGLFFGEPHSAMHPVVLCNSG